MASLLLLVGQMETLMFLTKYLLVIPFVFAVLLLSKYVERWSRGERRF
jgi:hypothetical protein